MNLGTCEADFAGHGSCFKDYILYIIPMEENIMSDILSRNRSKLSDNLELIYELEQLCHDIKSITGNNKR